MKRLFTVMMLTVALLSASASVFARDDKVKKQDGDKMKKQDGDTKKQDGDTKKQDGDTKNQDDDKKKQDGDKMKKQKQQSLYVRLGGKKAISAVVDEFVTNVANDNRINKFFADTVKDPKRAEKLKKNLVDQICEASGGPCKYKGKDMKTAHQGMGVSDADFGALVEDLVKALDKFNVGAEEKNALLGALGPMKGDIVEK